MIKLPEISPINKNMFLSDTYQKIFDLLTENKENPEFEKVISYCSTKDGKLDDKIIKTLITGDFSTLKKLSIKLALLRKRNLIKRNRPSTQYMLCLKKNITIFVTESLDEIGLKQLELRCALIATEVTSLLPVKKGLDHNMTTTSQNLSTHILHCQCII